MCKWLACADCMLWPWYAYKLHAVWAPMGLALYRATLRSHRPLWYTATMSSVAVLTTKYQYMHASNFKTVWHLDTRWDKTSQRQAKMFCVSETSASRGAKGLSRQEIYKMTTWVEGIVAHVFNKSGWHSPANHKPISYISLSHVSVSNN